MLEWGAAFLPSPADHTQPFVLTDEQALLTCQWYAVDPVTGGFPYRRALIEMAKGWGKSPLVGFWALAELGGGTESVSPGVLFDGWDANGEPVGRPWGTRGNARPWIQIAAVAEDQTENTYGAVTDQLTANDHKAARALGIDDGRTRLLLAGSRTGELSPVTTSIAREGQRITFVVLDETHLYTPSNGGTALAATARRNVAKMQGRSVETTNAPLLGRKTVAELSGRAAQRGAPGILMHARRPSLVPEPGWSDAQIREALVFAYGDAVKRRVAGRTFGWVDVDRLVQEFRDPANAWDDSLRFYANIRLAGSGLAVDPQAYERLAALREVARGTRIGLGFDGSINNDATFLRGCTAEGYTFIIRSWVRPEGAPDDWAVPRAEVNAAVAWAFEFYDVGRMLYDPPKWWTEGQAWEQAYNRKNAERVAALDTNQHEVRFSGACDRWLTGIRASLRALELMEGFEGPVLMPYSHDADPITVEHVQAAHLKKLRPTAAEDDGRTRYVIVKGDDPRRRIDGAVADVLAYEAAMTMPPPPARVRPFFLTGGS